MEPKPVHVIEYANLARQNGNSDEAPAFALGILAALLFALEVFIFLLHRRFYMIGAIALWFCPILNLCALILGGIGWGLSRHSRPNKSYRLCGWMNFLNWVSFFGCVVYNFRR